MTVNYPEWKEKYEVENSEKRGTISNMSGIINKPIEQAHPSDVRWGKELSKRQQSILDQLPNYGDRVTVNKRDVSMLDLSSMTAKTGDEFAMFTRQEKRLIVRGSKENIPLSEIDLLKLRDDGYKWSGHTHPGFMGANLIASQGDKDVLSLFEQGNSAIYNAAGRYSLIYPKD